MAKVFGGLLPWSVLWDQMIVRKKLFLAIASGLLAGGFMFHRFGFDNDGHLYGWQWYQGAVLLVAIGLAGMFPEAWQAAAIALAAAPTLVFCYEIVYLHPAESMWPVVLPLVFLSSFPAPIIGTSISSSLLTRTRIPRVVYFIALAGALIIGLLLPKLHRS
jgi:hypothetical protein